MKGAKEKEGVIPSPDHHPQQHHQLPHNHNNNNNNNNKHMTGLVQGSGSTCNPSDHADSTIVSPGGDLLSQPTQRTHTLTAPIVVRTGKQRHTQKGAKASALTETLPALPLHSQSPPHHHHHQQQPQQHNAHNKRPPTSRRDEDREIKRLKALRELLVTERSYVNDLAILLDVYLQSLATVLPSTPVPKGAAAGSGSTFSCSTIISAVATLLGVNRALLSSLEVRIAPYVSDDVIKERNGIPSFASSSAVIPCHPSSYPSTIPPSTSTTFSSSTASSSLPTSFYSPVPLGPSTDLVVGDIMLKMADFLKVTPYHNTTQ